MIASIQELLPKFLYIVLPFLVCVNSLMLLERVAHRFGLVDQPDDRKRHNGAIPLVGGPAMFVAIAVSCILLKLQFVVVLFLFLAFLLIAMGTLDDRLNLSVRHRFAVQILVAALMVFAGDLKILSVGDLVGSGPVILTGAIAIGFTIICIIGVINAANMIDGVDGLAGSIYFITFLGMGSLAISHDRMPSAAMLAIVCGALLGFLCFNARVFFAKAKVFMGDSGSMMMGFILAWFFISLTQGESAPVSAVAAGWLFGLPLIDTVAVMTQRIVNGNSPFKPGRDHLHYLLLDRGYTTNQTVSTLALLQGSLVLVAVLSNDIAPLQPFLFWGFVLLVVMRIFFTSFLINRISSCVQAKGSGSSK